MTRLALKFLAPGDRAPYSEYDWPTPNGKPGKWVAAKGPLVVCRNGIHAATLDQSLSWLNANAYLIELDGKVIDADDKLCARRGRLVRPLDWNLLLFAADCAEHVLHLFEDKHPDDLRPREAIRAAREQGGINHSAADAADAAAYAAHSADAAHSAHAAAYAARAAAYAAYAAYAARAAAYAAAVAEHRWQSKQLAKHLSLTKAEIKAVS